MTLFEADQADIEDLGARRTLHLPVPNKQRYMPLRAGVLNVWEYDDQQFWFEDGRLLLRGRNEAGKSKVLELLFPFVLDGDITPKKLDPFDTANKSMFWNMIGFNAERTVAIGYLWIEFGRLEEHQDADYLTVIVGVQATRAERKVSTWFALTPQRIDVDLDLAPGRVCRTQDAFGKALSVDARFTTRSSEHRSNVASRLFAMSSERFDNLLHLLRQLRKPKLADKLDNRKLSLVLTDALPPLDEARIEPLAKGFGFLDAHIEELRRTEVAHRATASFLDVYRTYARSQVRQRASAVTAAVTQFDNVTRAETAAERALEAARSKAKQLRSEAGRIALELHTASGSLDGLDLSAVETLHSLEQDADSDERLAASVRGEVQRAEENARLSRTRSDDLAAASEAERADVEQKAHLAQWGADQAGLGDEWLDPADPVVSSKRLDAAIRVQRALLDAVVEAERRAGKAQLALHGAEERVNAADARRDETADALAAATAASELARTRTLDDVTAWAALTPQDELDLDLDLITEQLSEGLDQGDRNARQVVSAMAAAARKAAEDAVELAAGGAARAHETLAAHQRALSAHDALPTDPPPAIRPGIPPTRSGTPLWLAVEFTDSVTANEAPLLEAALDAAGLLDAVITDSGLLTSDDTVLIADGVGTGVGEWLRPADGADVSLVAAALATVGAGRDSGSTCWVDVDGSWANGPLQGQWTKGTADHIGAAARANAQARRRGELVENIEGATLAAEDADRELEAARAYRESVASWVETFPSVTDWAAAERDEGKAAAAADRARTAHEEATRASDAVKAKAGDALRALALAEDAADCHADDVGDARNTLEVTAEAGRDLAVAATGHARTSEEATAAHLTAERLEAEARAATSRLEGAELEAARSSARYRTAVDLQGAEVEAILAEKERLEQQVSLLKSAKRTIDDEKEAAREDEIRAEGVLAETGRSRIRATEERDAALGTLTTVVKAGHVALAVALDATRDATDYLQPTAGRGLARQIVAAVSDLEATDDARSRATERLVDEFQKLRAEVGATFDPHLENVEPQLFQASATLNGELVGVGQLSHALAEEVELRRNAIAADERALIEQHLRDEVGNHLGDCLHAATTQVRAMNDTLRRHPTNSGATVQLKWQINDEAGTGARDAIRALLTSPVTRDEASSGVLASFLAERVALARRGDVDGADLTERLLAALDYRNWHRFTLTYKTSGNETELTARSVGSGSGGQQAKVSHLPLLAAAAGFYSSSPSAPRLCFLDEAFAGIDGPNTADLLAVSVSLDLDMVMTNYDAWFCVPQVPGLAIYHLEKLRDSVGVAAIRYEWDGNSQQEHDPWLDS